MVLLGVEIRSSNVGCTSNGKCRVVSPREPMRPVLLFCIVCHHLWISPKCVISLRYPSFMLLFGLSYVISVPKSC